MTDIRERTISRALTAGLFWGAVWGALEATLGYLLHFLPVLGFAGSIMFPVGAFCLLAARERGGITAMLPVPLVAAGLKLLDLALPGQLPVSVIHPAASILLQGIVLVLTVHLFTRTVYHIAAASLVWKGAFLLLLASGVTGRVGLLAAPAERLVLFLAGLTLVEVLLVRVSLRLSKRAGGFSPAPVPAFAALVLGAGLQLLFAGLA